MTDLYQEELLDHYKHPRNKGEIVAPDFLAGQENLSCGDKIVMQGKVTDGILTHVAFSGTGCVISQAAASMLTELCLGKNIDTILSLSKDDILKLVGIPLGPVRLKCALLALQVLQEGIVKFKNK
ncbi:MAG: iron-sulfur cluster assembly scaffold protein [bacterium]